MIRHFAREGDLPFSLFVFGTGAYDQQVLQLSQQHDNIHYF